MRLEKKNTKHEQSVSILGHLSVQCELTDVETILHRETLLHSFIYTLMTQTFLYISDLIHKEVGQQNVFILYNLKVIFFTFRKIQSS